MIFYVVAILALRCSTDIPAFVISSEITGTTFTLYSHNGGYSINKVFSVHETKSISELLTNEEISAQFLPHLFDIFLEIESFDSPAKVYYFCTNEVVVDLPFSRKDEILRHVRDILASDTFQFDYLDRNVRYVNSEETNFYMWIDLQLTDNNCFQIDNTIGLLSTSLNEFRDTKVQFTFIPEEHLGEGQNILLYNGDKMISVYSSGVELSVEDAFEKSIINIKPQKDNEDDVVEHPCLLSGDETFYDIDHDKVEIVGRADADKCHDLIAEIISNEVEPSYPKVSNGKLVLAGDLYNTYSMILKIEVEDDIEMNMDILTQEIIEFCQLELTEALEDYESFRSLDCFRMMFFVIVLTDVLDFDVSQTKRNLLFSNSSSPDKMRGLLFWETMTMSATNEDERILIALVLLLVTVMNAGFYSLLFIFFCTIIGYSLYIQQMRKKMKVSPINDEKMIEETPGDDNSDNNSIGSDGNKESDKKQDKKEEPEFFDISQSNKKDDDDDDEDGGEENKKLKMEYLKEELQRQNRFLLQKTEDLITRYGLRSEGRVIPYSVISTLKKSKNQGDQAVYDVELDNGDIEKININSEISDEFQRRLLDRIVNADSDSDEDVGEGENASGTDEPLGG